MRQRWIQFHKVRYPIGLALLLLIGLVAGVGALTHGWTQLTFPIALQEEEEEDAGKKVGEEVEDAGGGVKRSYNDVAGKAPSTDKSVKVTGVVSLKRAAKEAKHYAVKALFERLQVPHDEMSFKGLNDRGGESTYHWLRPLATFVGDSPQVNLQTAIQLQMIDAKSGKAINKPLTRSPKDMKPVVHYEQLALNQVAHFRDLCKGAGTRLGKKPFAELPKGTTNYLSYPDQLDATEKALSFVHAFVKQEHDKQQRAGAGWDELQQRLATELRNVIVKQLDLVIRQGNWDVALALARQTALRFPNRIDQKEVEGRMVAMLEKLLKSVDADFRTGSLRLQALQEVFPNARSQEFEEAQKQLQERALYLVNQAKEKYNKSPDANREEALELLRQADRIYPIQESIDFRLVIKKDILHVGVAQSPIHLCPSLAWTDSEHQALELLFEGLIELSPDPSVVRYRPVLAKGRPHLMYLGRKFRLPVNLQWSDGKELASGDVEHTVEMLKDPNRLGYTPAWANRLVSKVEQDGNRFALQIRLSQGYYDPLSLMAFKVLPQGFQEDETFAKDPITSGPYRYFGEKSRDGRSYTLFKKNEAYNRRQRAEQRDLPHIGEIRFFVTKDPVEELKNGRLHLVLDLTAEQVEEVKRNQRELFVTPPLPSRRIYFLALNQKEDRFLRNAKFRRALAHAINRTDVLNQHYRKGLTGKIDSAAHHELNGPYPVGSWAFNPNLAGRRLYNPGIAQQRLKEAEKELPGGVLPSRPFSLIYPDGDPRLEAAMKQVAANVKESFEGKIEVQLRRLQPADVRKQVLARRYDIAFFHHDYQDHTYWLYPLLDPQAATGDRSNYLGFTSSGSIQEQFKVAMKHRNFNEVREATHEIHRLFTEEEMPFIPLWQLDRFVAYRRELKLYEGPDKLIPFNREGKLPIDPLRIFCDVEHWILTPRKSAE